ncbi:MAG: HYR domain-containing protein [Terrimicrobiaceae bacterium]|nr:HYR domain-containing protein [Terrimicrobiaceae bacterium]
MRFVAKKCRARACHVVVTGGVALLVSASPLSGADSIWTGALGADFGEAGNWNPAAPADDLTTDLAIFTGVLTANQAEINGPRSVAGLGFSSAGGGWALAGMGRLTLGGGGISALSQTGGTTTISTALQLGANQTWAIGANATLLLTGSITAGESTSVTFPGQLIIGGSNAGDIVWDPSAGRSVGLYASVANAGALQVNQRLVLGAGANSTSSVNTIFNASSAGIRVSNAGLLEVRAGEWRTNDLGSNNSGAFTGRLVISGGTLATGGGRYLGQFNGSIGTRVSLTGGRLLVTGGGNVLVNAGHLGLGAHGANTPTGTITFDVAGGVLDVARGAGNFPANSGISSAALSLGGVANTTVLMNQSGGTVRVGLTTGSHVFSGATNANAFANLSIGSNLAGNQAAYTLTGGTLLVAGAVQGLSSPGGVSNFNFLGGVLATATFTATYLGHSPGATDVANQTTESLEIGTLVNRGGTVAPGGMGTAGRTAVAGSYRAVSGALEIDLGGTTQATGFQAGTYDFLGVTGSAVLGGDLVVNVLPGFTPSSAQVFTILSSASLTGAFANVGNGSRVVSADGRHTFQVNQSATSVTLSNYIPVGPPVLSSSSAPEVIASGDHVVLNVAVSSLAPVTYEWRRNGQVISGATGNTLTLFGFSDVQAGEYEVTIRNAVGQTSRMFPVRTTVPAASIQRIVDAGATETFFASPGASSYRWILNGEEVGTTQSFAYSPGRREVGTHWLRVVETYADGSAMTRHWTVRVRLQFAESGTFLYVSPAGLDTNNGGIGAPFRTLERARDAARSIPGGVTIYLRGGVHRRTTTFTLSAQDSGTENAPRVYAAYPGETPILTSSRVLNASLWSPLAASEHFRIAPGINAARIWETDVSGNARANAFPNIFNEWLIFNALRSSQNGGLLELFQNGQRRFISRYPNYHPTDDTLTPNLQMDGVATGAATDGSGYLNSSGNYTLSNGTVTPVGCAFHYSAADAARVDRWQSAISRGGLWLMGYWRVPWQVNGLRASVVDPGKRVIGFTSTPNLGIGDKYTRPVGTKKEPWWVVNLLEEMDVPGEWAIDFSRQRLYLLMDRDGAPADGEIELSDSSVVLFQMNGANDVVLRGLTFQRHLGISVQMLGGTRNLVVGCRFEQTGNVAVEIRDGTQHGVLSSDFSELASGGIMMRGGVLTPQLVFSNHFAVNNRFRSFSEVVRVYQAAIDAGYGGPLGTWGQTAVGMRIAHNDIRTTPHAAILWNGHRHAIEFNEVSNFTRISNDFGGIYRYGPNIDAETIIRFNHIYASPQGEGIYNDFDHVRSPVYGNTINLKTPAAASRGFGFWSTTNTEAGAAVPGLPTTLRVFNNIAVNSRENFVLHSSTGGRIENNVSFRPNVDHFRWRRITTNGTTQSISNSNAATLASGPNTGYASDPGFLDFSNDDLRLRPDSRVYSDMPGFERVPLEMAGLFHDEFRTSGMRVWSPFVVTGPARAVGANTATFTGELVYPQFDQNATVRVYWGTVDGGSDEAAWQRMAVLGQPASGQLAYTPSDLAPGTRYFFRFQATNSAGEHWAEQSNSTTTFGIEDSAVPGTASSDAEGTSPDAAFDDNALSSWQAPFATGAATLGYAFHIGAVRVTRYSVTSSSDHPSRDPRDWRFEGSLDGVNWIVLDQRSGVSFPGRAQTLSFGFNNAVAFPRYRLVITANAGDSETVQIAEVSLQSPLIVADTTGPVISTPGNLIVSGNASGAVVTFEVSALDAVSGEAQVIVSPSSGSVFPLGTTPVNVTATDAAGNVSSASFTVTVQPPTLPTPWTLQQIRPFSAVAPGTVEVLSSTSFRIVGAGGASTGGTTADLWTGTNDSNTYLSVPWQGDGIFTARLASFSSTDAAAKAGIIFRESTNSGSRYSTIYVIRNNGGSVLFQHKTATNGASTGTNFFNGSVTNRGIPEWIRLVRQGDTFSLYYSENGVNWTWLSTRANAMSGAGLSVGFVVAPRTGNTTATAVFDNISFVTPQQSWRQTYFGGTANTGSAADGADPDGDGFSNLMEYALGTTPNAAQSQPVISYDIVGIESEPGRFLDITFNRVADPGLTYRVEASQTLAPAGWVTIWQSTGAANTPGAVTVVDPFDIDSGSPPQRFLRLKVSSP